MGANNTKPRLLIIGLDGAGKTSIIYKLKLAEVLSTVPTIGFCVETAEYKNLSLTVIDLGGQEKISHLWRHYYEGTSAVIVVVDGSDTDRLDYARDEIHKVLKDSLLQPKCIALFVNKMDLPEAVDDISSISDKIFDTQLELTIPHCAFRTSIMDSNSLDLAFSWIAAATTPKPVSTLSFMSTTLKKITGLFNRVDSTPSTTKSDSSSSDSGPTQNQLKSSTDSLISMIPTDEALQDNVTFLRAFEQCLLPIHAWTHRSHLRVAWLYLRLHWPNHQKAQESIMNGIQRYNMEYSRHKPLQTGFHLTMTIFWITIIRNALQQDQTGTKNESQRLPDLRSFDDFCQKHVELTDSRLFGKYYTREVLFTETAKTQWTPPNLEPLPIDPIVSKLPENFSEVKSAPDGPRPAPMRNYEPQNFEVASLKVSVPSESCAQ